MEKPLQYIHSRECTTVLRFYDEKLRENICMCEHNFFYFMLFVLLCEYWICCITFEHAVFFSYSTFWRKAFYSCSLVVFRVLFGSFTSIVFDAFLVLYATRRQRKKIHTHVRWGQKTTVNVFVITHTNTHTSSISNVPPPSKLRQFISQHRALLIIFSVFFMLHIYSEASTHVLLTLLLLRLLLLFHSPYTAQRIYVTVTVTVVVASVLIVSPIFHCIFSYPLRLHGNNTREKNKR